MSTTSKGFSQIFLLVTGLILAAIFLFSFNFKTKPEQKKGPPLFTHQGSSSQCNVVFVTTAAVPTEETGIEFRDKYIKEMIDIKNTGISVIGQPLSEYTTSDDWIAYLDAAQDNGLKVTFLFPNKLPGVIPSWNGTNFDLNFSGEVLQAVKDHPALYSFALYDEPWEEMSAEQLRVLYSQAKEIAPNVNMLVGFSRQIVLAAESNNRSRDFTSGMCDTCLISSLDYRRYPQDGNKEIFYEETLRKTHKVSREIISREAPEARIGTNTQLFGSSGSSYYFPTLDEYKKSIDIILSDEMENIAHIDEIILQRWDVVNKRQQTGSKRDMHSLRDPENAEYREYIRELSQHLNSKCEIGLLD